MATTRPVAISGRVSMSGSQKFSPSTMAISSNCQPRTAVAAIMKTDAPLPDAQSAAHTPIALAASSISG